MYVAKLIPSSAHFLRSLVCSTKCVLLQNVDVHYFVFALSANLINMGLGIFCRNQSFLFCAFYRCADFSQYFRIFPCFYEYIFKINGSYLGFFREICLLCLLWRCFLSIVIAILKTRDFGYLHQIVTKLRNLLILLSVIWYQLSFVCYCHLFHLLISFFFSLCHLCAVLGCQIVA